MRPINIEETLFRNYAEIKFGDEPFRMTRRKNKCFNVNRIQHRPSSSDSV